MSELAQLSRIPQEYRKFWVPFKTRDTFLYHLTVKDNWEIIKTIGYLEPRDPAPKHWAGMHAVFMSDPHDPWFEENQRRVQKHVKDTPTLKLRFVLISAKSVFSILLCQSLF